ncbi:Transcriptional regulator [Microbacterium sp. C448]|uniref:LysR family transcriptional regulator n=1 Tax=Microbacterium sp. C448 TaxID=1177594 RepID=UPI0003DE4682|nr:LysR family transcriptional regulator [Microbacterium sp. C448]CDJ99059.1 Transcriptional regulator [Microbacterium sp. C448]
MPSSLDESEDVELDPRITLAVLRQLVALETHGSLGAVARELRISQPTVSANLARLERILGFPFLLRSTTGTQLTQEGVAIAATARSVLTASRVLAQTIADVPRAVAAPLRIAASLTIAEQLVPRWLADRHISGLVAPGRATLSVGNSGEVMEWIAREQADIGFVEGNTFHPRLVHLPIGHDELVAVVGPAHRWFTERRQITPAELIRGGLVLREQGSGTLEVLEHALARAGVDLPPDLPSFGSTSAILTAARHGGAVAVVSRLTVETELAEGKLAALSVPDLDLSRRLSAVWVQERPQRADAAGLISNIISRWKSVV